MPDICVSCDLPIRKPGIRVLVEKRLDFEVSFFERVSAATKIPRIFVTLEKIKAGPACWSCFHKFAEWDMEVSPAKMKSGYFAEYLRQDGYEEKICYLDSECVPIEQESLFE